MVFVSKDENGSNIEVAELTVMRILPAFWDPIGSNSFLITEQHGVPVIFTEPAPKTGV